MLNYTKQQIRDVFLGFLSVTAIVSSVNQVLFLFYEPTFVAQWFFVEVFRFGIISILSIFFLIFFKRFEASKEFKKAFIWTFIFYILAAVIGTAIAHYT